MTGDILIAFIMRKGGRMYMVNNGNIISSLVQQIPIGKWL